VDASGNAGGTGDDFWVFWDDLPFSYFACDPLPSGWSASGGAIYRSLVSGGILESRACSWKLELRGFQGGGLVLCERLGA